MPQSSIFGPLFFLFYVNDLNKVSDVLDPIIFADDTNLFYSHQNIKTLFETANSELQGICEWFRANRFYLNVTKTNYALFHQKSTEGKLPSKIFEFKIGKSIMKRKSSVKFLGVMLYENIPWKDDIKTIEKKLAKSIGLLYRAKPYLDKNFLKAMCFSYIHSYLNYANNAWTSIRITKLNPLIYK